ncbi:MAG: prolipoprotein diacylglyceryl transferase [Prevotellaceae bacterium]|jgi:prolipoprotein diacylglyceryl transferase|nr:prolipoprotein diacylglyceryl transferase [Prevotellaceae bacterium]
MTSFLAITWNPDPEIFSLGPIHVRYYGLLFVGAFIASYYVFLYVFKREKIPIFLLEKLTIYVALATLIGARLGHCFFYDLDYFLTHPLEIILPIKFQPEFKFVGFQGLASHGATIGILIGIWYWCRKHKKNYLWLLDRMGIVGAMSGTFVRLGNLMNSEIYGGETTLPWGFIFVRAGETQPHHPTQLYEAFSYFAIFCLLFFLYRKKSLKMHRGFLFGIFLILLFSARFFIEFIKNTQVDFEESMFFNMGQLLSLPFIIAGIFLLWRSFRKKESFFQQIITNK